MVMDPNRRNTEIIVCKGQDLVLTKSFTDFMPQQDNCHCTAVFGRFDFIHRQRCGNEGMPHAER